MLLRHDEWFTGTCKNLEFAGPLSDKYDRQKKLRMYICVKRVSRHRRDSSKRGSCQDSHDESVQLLLLPLPSEKSVVAARTNDLGGHEEN